MAGLYRIGRAGAFPCSNRHMHSHPHGVVVGPGNIVTAKVHGYVSTIRICQVGVEVNGTPACSSVHFLYEWTSSNRIGQLSDEVLALYVQNVCGPYILAMSQEDRLRFYASTLGIHPVLQQGPNYLLAHPEMGLARRQIRWPFG